MDKKFRLQILRRIDDGVEETLFARSILEIEELVDKYFYTDGELNLRNIKCYYQIAQLNDDGEYVVYRWEV